MAWPSKYDEQPKKGENPPEPMTPEPVPASPEPALEPGPKLPPAPPPKK